MTNYSTSFTCSLNIDRLNLQIKYTEELTRTETISTCLLSGRNPDNADIYTQTKREMTGNDTIANRTLKQAGIGAVILYNIDLLRNQNQPEEINKIATYWQVHQGPKATTNVTVLNITVPNFIKQIILNINNRWSQVPQY